MHESNVKTFGEASVTMYYVLAKSASVTRVILIALTGLSPGPDSV